MASSNIDIKIKTIIEGIQGIQKLTDQLMGLKGQAAGVSSAASGASGGLSGLGSTSSQTSGHVEGLSDLLGRIKDNANSAGSGLAELRGHLGGVSQGFDSLVGYTKAAAAAFLAFLAIKGVKELADYAARTETLGVTLDIVAKNAGYTKEEVGGFEAELKKLGITTQAARESMTAMIQAGIPLGTQAGQTASNVARLARAAQDLAVVTGENSSETLRRLTTNIQQMDTMGLRFMGLTVDIQAAQQKYAQSLGISTEAMTQQQKVMAVNNAVLEESAKLQGAYEASMETVGKKVASLKRYQEELADAMGKKLLPAYGAVVDGATNLLTTLTKLADGTDVSGEAAARLGDDVRSLTNELVDLVSSIAVFVSENISLFSSIGSNVSGVISDIVEFTNAITSSAEGAGIWKAALWSLALAVAGFRDGLKLVQAVAYEVQSAITDVVGDILKGMGLVARATGFTEVGDSLLAMADSFYAVSKASGDSADHIIQDFSNGNTATKRFLDGVDEVRVSLSSFGKATSFKGVADELVLLASASESGALKADDLAKASVRAAEDVTDLAKSGKLTEKELQALIEAAKEAGIELPQGFGNAKEALKTMAAQAKTAQEVMAGLGNSTSFAGLTKELNSVIRAQKEGILSSQQAGEAFSVLSGLVDRFAESSEASKKQVADLRGQLLTIGTGISDDFDKALKDIGTSVDQLASGVSPKFAQISTGLNVLAQNAKATSDQFRNAFSQSIDSAKTVAELNLMSDAFISARKHGEALIAVGKNDEGAKWLKAAADAADVAAVKFESLFATSLKSAKTSADFKKLEDDVRNFGEVSGKSADWVTARIEKIGLGARNAAKDIAESGSTEALKAIGTTAEEVQGQASRAIQGVVAELAVLRAEATTTADAYFNAFSKAVSMTKAIADLQGFRAELNAALNEGTIGWSEYASAIQVVDQQFDKLFQSQLKAATTKEAIDQLKNSVLKLGAEGSISATAMANALQLIADKASGGTAEVLRLAEESSKLAQKQAELATAGKTLLDAQLGVHKAMNELVKAKNIDQQKSTDITKAEVAAAEAGVKAAEAREVVQARILEQKQAEVDLAQAQNVLDAAKAEYARNNTAENQRAVLAAQDYVNEVKTGVVQLQQAVSEAQALAAETEGAAAAASSYAKNLSSSSTTSASLAGTAQQVYTTTRLTADVIKKAYIDAGLSAAEANALTVKWGNSLDQNNIKSEQGVKVWYSQFAKFQDELVTIKKRTQDNAAALASMGEQASGVRQNFADIVEQAEMASVGVSNWRRGADAVSQAYAEIRKQAISAAQSAVEAAASFASSAMSIREELLQAQGREEEAANLRYESRKRELALQYQQLQIQIQIARVQAQAAGVDTSQLDASAAEAERMFSQSMSDLGELQSLAIAKIRDTAAAAANNIRETVTANAPDQGVQNDSSAPTNDSSAPTDQVQPTDTNPMPVEVVSDNTVQEATPPTIAVEGVSDQVATELTRVLSDNTESVLAQASPSNGSGAGSYPSTQSGSAVVFDSEATTVLREILTVLKDITSRRGVVGRDSMYSYGPLSAANDYSYASSTGVSGRVTSGTVQFPHFNAVDVSKFVLELGDRKAEVYTKPGEGADLWNLMEDLKRRSSGG